MKKKEYYKHILPHFQQLGQAYFVTWNLKDAVPAKAIARYKSAMFEKQNQIEIAKTFKKEKSLVEDLQRDYYQLQKKYIKAYNDILDRSQPSVNL